MTLPIDFSAINTALLLGGGAYLWKQSRGVDELRQALLGYGDKGGGALDEIKQLRQRTYELVQSLATLNIAVGHLTTQLIDLQIRSPNARSRKSDPREDP